MKHDIKLRPPQLTQLTAADQAKVDEAKLKASEYWEQCNQQLLPGYTLSVAIQNHLDETYQVLVDGIKTCIDEFGFIDHSRMGEFIKTVPLNNLSPMLNIREGVATHYHCHAGVDRNEHKLELDLKVIPTIIDPYGQPLNALVFIAFSLEFVNRQPSDRGAKYRIVLTDAIGVGDYLHLHRPFYSEDGSSRSAAHMGSSALGHFMKWIRSLKLDQPLPENLIQSNDL